MRIARAACLARISARCVEGQRQPCSAGLLSIVCAVVPSSGCDSDGTRPSRFMLCSALLLCLPAPCSFATSSALHADEARRERARRGEGEEEKHAAVAGATLANPSPAFSSTRPPRPLACAPPLPVHSAQCLHCSRTRSGMVLGPVCCAHSHRCERAPPSRGRSNISPFPRDPLSAAARVEGSSVAFLISPRFFAIGAWIAASAELRHCRDLCSSGSRGMHCNRPIAAATGSALSSAHRLSIS